MVSKYFSKERMSYVTPPDSLDGAAKVIYQSKNGKKLLLKSSKTHSKN
jgi:hypothetical protein